MDASHGWRATYERRFWAALILACVPILGGASARTANFVVDAPTVEIAQRVAEHAESCRKAFALAWLGKELPPWPAPCPVRVKLTSGEAGGLTSFGFAKGQVADQTMSVEGRIDRILASALPHEVTHTIFAAYLGGPMPSWADEGASLLSEDRREIDRHEQIVAQLLERRGDMPLGRLFQMEDYPSDLMGFYGQGYSVSRFLVEIGGRARFLQFVKDGPRSGWDAASRTHYGLANVRELDRAWRSWHKVVAESSRTRPAAIPLVVRAQSTGESPGR
jgi:hypothetical protein